jgi:trk system potassium uptake protein TrkH
MHLAASLRVMSFLLMVFSLSQLPPLAIAWWYDEAVYHPFISSGAITFFSGLILFLLTFRNRDELRTRDGFFIVVLFWIILSVFGALPFMLADSPHVSFVDAVFESASGLTTTGATVLTGLDQMPKAILYYRQQLHFLGGMGIIVLAVAVMPMLGIGGLALFRAETSGMLKDSKLTPRIAETAKALWIIYISLIVLCALAYWAHGMTVFDAINFSFSTIATGGFAPYDANFAAYPQTSLKLWATFFMLMGSLNFSLHYFAFRHGQFSSYWRDSELRNYIFFLLASTALIACILITFKTFAYPSQSIIESLFHVVSLSTTTGFTSTDFGMWPLFVPILIMIIGLIGGCAGSTSGGIKMIRVVLLIKQGWREIHRLIHPNGIFIPKFNGKMIPEHVMDAVWGFIGVYVVLFNIILMTLMACGLDFISAWSAVIACIANVGPGLGSVTFHYGEVSDTAKWVLSFAMIIGRLEIFTVMVLLTPAFWRQ